MKYLSSKLLVGALAIGGCSSAFASLTTFQDYTGANYGVSTSGWGSSSSSSGGSIPGILTSVPTGATLVSAYLYSAYLSSITPTVTLDGTSVDFTQNNPNTTACCGIGSERAMSPASWRPLSPRPAVLPRRLFRCLSLKAIPRTRTAKSLSWYTKMLQDLTTRWRYSTVLPMSWVTPLR